MGECGMCCKALWVIGRPEKQNASPLISATLHEWIKHRGHHYNKEGMNCLYSPYTVVCVCVLELIDLLQTHHNEYATRYSAFYIFARDLCFTQPSHNKRHTRRALVDASQVDIWIKATSTLVTRAAVSAGCHLYFNILQMMQTRTWSCSCKVHISVLSRESFLSHVYHKHRGSLEEFCLPSFYACKTISYCQRNWTDDDWWVIFLFTCLFVLFECERSACSAVMSFLPEPLLRDVCEFTPWTTPDGTGLLKVHPEKHSW